MSTDSNLLITANCTVTSYGYRVVILRGRAVTKQQDGLQKAALSRDSALFVAVLIERRTKRECS